MTAVIKPYNSDDFPVLVVWDNGNKSAVFDSFDGAVLYIRSFLPFGTRIINHYDNGGIGNDEND